MENQIEKFAASKDKAVSDQMASGVTTASDKVAAGAKSTEKPAVDIAKFAGIFAAVGLALSAIGTTIGMIATSFISLKPWQMPLAVLGALLVISGPSMLLAWFKLRARNIAPLLDANGWAINTNAKLSINFGTRLLI